MRRFNDWPERLIEFIEARRHVPFQWGTNDCALFAADAVLAMTGTDLAEKWRGYTDEAGARARIEAEGGMKAFARDLLAKEPGLARFGDIVLARIDGSETFGISLRNFMWCAPGPNGLAFRFFEDIVTVFEF